MKPIFAIALPMLMGAITPFPTACGPVRATGDAPGRAVYTSLRSITALYAAPDGAVFAGTAGGILRRDPATGKWQPFTRAELPAHEVRAFAELGGETCALFAGGGAACYGKDGWYGMPNAARWFAHPPHQIQVRYGDTRLFRKIANAWVAQQEITLPGGAAKEMTAITKAGGAYYVGTRKQGLWRRHGDETVWESVAISEQDPLDHNAQAIAFHDDAMFVSTLQNGLVVRTATGKWQHVAPPTISTNAPRQMITFQNALYVRHGNGVVDRLAGGTWARNIWAHDLPRKQVSAFVSDAGYIYAAQWGGVSVFDGAEWTHYLREPGLQGVPITALAPDGDTLYIGTQGRGLAEMNRHTGEIRRFFNEAHGMPDDWITALAMGYDGTVYAGTFVGGLAVRAARAARFTVAPSTTGENVTGILPLATGGAFLTTRFGARVTGTPTVLPELVTAKIVEAQCVARSPTGDTWIGTRTGLYRVKP